MQAQQERDQLRSTNVKLERSNQLLSNQADKVPDADTTVRRPKREAESTLPAKVPKRARPTQRVTAEQAIADTQDQIENDSNFLDTLGVGKAPFLCNSSSRLTTHIDGANLTEALFTTHSLCGATSLNTDSLCLNLVQTASALGSVIRVVTENHEQLLRQGSNASGAKGGNKSKSNFAHALSICARAFMSILVGTSKLAGACADQRLASLIVGKLAEMFKTGLVCVELLAQRAAQMSSNLSEQPKKGKGKAPGNSLGEAVPAREVSHLLSSFLGFLDKSDPVHRNIFEAFIFILFERVGRRLHYCTFGRSTHTSIEESILATSSLQNKARTTERNADDLTIKFEVQSLMVILERAVGLAPNHMNPQSRKSTNSDPVSRTLSFRSLPAASKARLSLLARDRLQRTLIACMYGNKPNDDFLDILTKPLPAMRSPSSSSISAVDNQGVEDWYKKEVWRIVGWDILAREGGW